jgi:hypothetical protein
VHGRFPGEVSAEGEYMIVNGKRIRVTAERDPAKLPHKELGVDIALEDGAGDEAADAAEAVDCYFSHQNLPEAVRAELVEALSLKSAALRQAQGEREFHVFKWVRIFGVIASAVRPK